MKRVLILLTIRVFLIGGVKQYPEPLYYTVYETEDVIIKYSRELHDDIYGIRFKTAVSANKRFKGLTHKEIEYNTILETRSINSEEIKKKAGIIE